MHLDHVVTVPHAGHDDRIVERTRIELTRTPPDPHHVPAYSGDSGPSEQLPALARDTDLFVCEATLLDGEPDLRGHLTLPEAEEAFEQSGARRLLVTHRPKERPTDGLHELAYEGLEITISDDH